MSESGSWSLETMADLAPRDVFGKVMVELGRDNPRIVALSPDLVLSTKLRDFARAYPDRFFDTGITEQATVGMAAGMATCGLLPFVATFACFASMRACEQIRTDICYPGLNVKIVGSHAGLSMGAGGTTHHATEDIAIMRSLANMVVLVPSDPVQTIAVLKKAAEYDGPCYIRLIRGAESPLLIYESIDSCDFAIGKANLIKKGDDVTVIAAGSPVVQESLTAARTLEGKGISVRVLDMASVKPLDREAVVQAARETRGILTVEDHTIIGGLGGAVAEVLAEEGCPTRLKRVGIPDTYATIGPPHELWTRYGLTADSLVPAIQEFARGVW